MQCAQKHLSPTTSLCFGRAPESLADSTCDKMPGGYALAEPASPGPGARCTELMEQRVGSDKRSITAGGWLPRE